MDGSFFAAHAVPLAFVTLLPLACGGGGEDPSSASAGNGGAGATGGVLATGGSAGDKGGGGAAGSTGGGSSCPAGPGHATSDALHAIDKLGGKVVELDGSPAKNTWALLCSLHLCVKGTTDENGVISMCDPQTKICSPDVIAYGQKFERAAFRYGDGLGYGKFALLLPTDTSDYDVGTQITVALPPLTAGAAMTPGSAATSGGVTLSITAGGKVDIDELIYTEPDEQKFRAAEIPIAKAPDAVDKTLGFEILVATAPNDTKLCPPAKLTVPNTPGWAPGTEVELFMHGLDPAAEWAPYAGWAKVSSGAVDADGKTVSTAQGEGVPVLSVFGVRKK